MLFYSETVYHIFNQGNNRQQVFFCDNNYYYFIWKMQAYLLPFGDFIAWCLMPNHFHWLFYVMHPEIKKSVMRENYLRMEEKRLFIKYGRKIKRKQKNVDKPIQEGYVSLNQAIGYVQRVYTQSFNSIHGRSGSLFRQKCKAKAEFEESKFSFTNKRTNNYKVNINPELNYISKCFHYIHQNPVAAGLADHVNGWRFSSAREYAGDITVPLCNIELAKKLIVMEENIFV